MSNRRVRQLCAAAAATASAMAFFGSSARAVDYTWLPTGPGTFDWSVTTNWDPTGTPSVSGDSANLAIAATGNQAITLPSNFTITALKLGHSFNTDIGNAGAGPGKLVFAGTGSITSLGTGVNSITNGMILNGNLLLDATSTNDLSMTGGMQPDGGDRTVTNSIGAKTVTIGGTIPLYDATTPATSRNFNINGGSNSITVVNATFQRGDGVTTGNTGVATFGGSGSQVTATYILNAAQTIPAIALNKQTYVLNNNAALGVGLVIAASNNNNSWGTQIVSTDDSRVLANNFRTANGMAAAGTHSFTIDGWVSQRNARAMGNLLPVGKQLTLSGAGTTGISIATAELDADGNRVFIIDGPGLTVVNGTVKNSTETDSPSGDFQKRGTGTVKLNNPTSTYKGATTVNGGMLEFGANGAWGATTGITVNATGSTWFTPGSANADFGTFLGKIVNTSAGALALPASEAATSFNFTAGNLVNAANMTLGAQGNITYTGTVTPGAAGYGFGGGFLDAAPGHLTLNGNNRMTGANAVRYANGGTVTVTGTQDYTGVTTLGGSNMATAQVNMANKTGGTTTTTNVFFSTVLDVTSIANGGVDSVLGRSSNAAANLVFNGGTLRYTGAALGSTDRNFTVADNGAFFDSSGAGALQFVSGSANPSTGTPARTVTLTGTNTGANTISGALSDTAALSSGTLSISKTGAGKWILGGVNLNGGTNSVSGGVLEIANTGRLGGGTVAVSGGATLSLAAGNATGEKASALTVDATSFVDMFDNDMVVGSTTPTATVVALVKNARNGGLWNQPGITSTSARNVSTTGLGVLSGAEYSSVGGTGTFSGQAYAAGDTLVKYTWNGDANLDGRVTFDDYVKIDTGFNTQLTGWLNGDFNYSGNVSFDDYVLIDIAFNQQNGTLGRAIDWISGDDRSTAGLDQAGLGEVIGHLDQFGTSYAAAFLAAVPEPTSLALLGVPALAGMIRRRRRTH